MIEIDRFHWNLSRAFIGMSTLLAIIGPVCNFVIVLTTIKTSSMRSTCNILIALCAIGDMFSQFGTLMAQLPILFGAQLEIDTQFCDILMFLPEMGITIGAVCVLFIGVDRLFSVILPVSYKSVNRLYYHCSITVLILGSCVHVSYVMYFYFEPRVALCEILTHFANGLEWFTFPILIINIISPVIYFATWACLRAKADSTLMKRIVKSLLIIVSMDAGGWIMTPLFIYLVLNSDLEPQQKFAWTYFGANFINIALSAKLFIYYSTSSEYRTAINIVLGKNSSKISSVTVSSGVISRKSEL